MPRLTIPLAIALLAALPVDLMRAAESAPARYPGLKELRLVTDVEAVRPGDAFTVGLLLRHEPGYHTYWQSPGIVGVPTMIQWKDLPAGVTAGPIQWPAPQTTKMAQLTAWGYETDTCLLVPFQAPADLSGKTEITLKARVGWMCCATSCHPGWHEFALTIPVSQDRAAPVAADPEWSEAFAQSRARLPVAAPPGWQFTAREIDPATIQLIVHAPKVGAGLDFSKVQFYSHDNQVDSDEPQLVADLSGLPGAVFTFSRPEFAPENPPALSGVLFHPDGWPGTKSRWMIASAPWPGYQVRHGEGEDPEKDP
jgi:DsbC/DsbD-like thiol-disulfide interchange protein